MTNETILYLSDHATNSNSVLAALKATGCEVVSTNSATQAIALLYVLHTVAGVVLNRRAREQNTCELARSLQAIRPDVPIVLLCSDLVDLGDVTAIDAAGLGALISLPAAGSYLRPVDPSETVRRVLRLTNLHSVFGISESECRKPSGTLLALKDHLGPELDLAGWSCGAI
jgi:CheY-like chemotaxis protein